MSEEKQAVCWITGRRYSVGDIVTRSGDDRHKIVDIDGGDMIEVECVQASIGYLQKDGTRDEPIYKVGDRQWNLTRRYRRPDDTDNKAVDDLLLSDFSMLSQIWAYWTHQLFRTRKRHTIPIILDRQSWLQMMRRENIIHIEQMVADNMAPAIKAAKARISRSYHPKASI